MQNFGFNFGLLGGAGGAPGNNMCWTTLEDTGTVYSGTVSPATTSDGTTIYNVQFDTSDGEFIMQFGDAGDEELDNTALITFTYKGGYELPLYWDATNEYYSGTDTDLATEIALLVDEKVCFGAYVTPDLTIWYDFITEAD